MTTIQPLSRFRAFVLANAMLVMFFTSVTISVLIAIWIGHYTVDIAQQHLLHRTFAKYIPYYDIPAFFLEIFIIVWYERLIRRLIKNLYKREKSSPAEIIDANRRLLNEPFFLMGLNLVSWIGAAIFYYVLARGVLLQPELAKELIVHSLLTAVIGVLATFFSCNSVSSAGWCLFCFPKAGCHG